EETAHLEERVIQDLHARIKLLNKEAELFVRRVDDSLANSLPVSKDRLILPEEQIQFLLEIRTRRHGDRMHYEGLEGTKKIKDIFIDEKVSQTRREQWPILTDQSGTILWVIGLRKSPFRYTDDGRYLLFEYMEKDV